MTDLERAKALGMTLDQFQRLAGYDPLEMHPEFSSARCMDTEDDEEDNKTENGTPKLKKIKKVPNPATQDSK